MDLWEGYGMQHHGVANDEDQKSRVVSSDEIGNLPPPSHLQDFSLDESKYLG